MRLHMIRKTERDRSKQSTTRWICRAAILSSIPSAGPHRQAQIVEDGVLQRRLATECLKRSKIMDGTHKGRKQWEKDSCGQHSFSHWVLMRLHMTRDEEKDISWRTNPTLSHLTITYYSSQERFNEFPHGGHLHLPSLEGTHCYLEDVVPPTRQRGKTFYNRLTGPQLGAKNSKPRPGSLRPRLITMNKTVPDWLTHLWPS